MCRLLCLCSVQVWSAGSRFRCEGRDHIYGWINRAKTLGNWGFVHDYRAKYNGEPNVFSALAYTSVYILAEAISSAGSTDSHAIRDALAITRDFDTVLGRLSFDDVGGAEYDPVMLIVWDGKFEVFKLADFMRPLSTSRSSQVIS